jgi:hypothetical protein
VLKEPVDRVSGLCRRGLLLLLPLLLLLLVVGIENKKRLLYSYYLKHLKIRV